MTWYELLDLLTAIRKLEVIGLINGTELANKLLDYYIEHSEVTK